MIGGEPTQASILREYVPYLDFMLTINIFFCLVLPPTQLLRNVKASHHVDIGLSLLLALLLRVHIKRHFSRADRPAFSRSSPNLRQRHRLQGRSQEAGRLLFRDARGSPQDRPHQFREGTPLMTPAFSLRGYRTNSCPVGAISKLLPKKPRDPEADKKLTRRAEANVRFTGPQDPR